LNIEPSSLVDVTVVNLTLSKEDDPSKEIIFRLAATVFVWDVRHRHT
jgi:hypothetical protein